MNTKTAYESYRYLLIKSRFEMINESAYSFMAVNETTVVYCQL